jgi:DNA-binding IclR family transcriptional regulator
VVVLSVGAGAGSGEGAGDRLGGRDGGTAGDERDDDVDLGGEEEEGEVTEGIASVGTAVLDHSGHPIAAVALTFPEQEVPDEDGRRSLAAQVARTAGTITRLIGG